MVKIIKNMRIFIFIIILTFFKITLASSEIVTKINIIGNDRVSDETILMFTSLSKNQNINDVDINSILKVLYETNFFKDVKVQLTKGVLKINVIENPIIYNIKFNGLKSKSLTDVKLP